MPDSKCSAGTYKEMIVEVFVETHPTQKQRQDWKDLWTWLLTPRDEQLTALE